MTNTTKRAGDPALSVGPTPAYDGHSKTRVTHTHSFPVHVPVHNVGSVEPFIMHVKLSHSHDGKQDPDGEHLSAIAHLDGHWTNKSDQGIGSGSGRSSMDPDITRMKRTIDRMSPEQARDVLRSAQTLSPMDTAMRTVLLDRRSPTDRWVSHAYSTYTRRYKVQM